jgi:hypothetical protein
VTSITVEDYVTHLELVGGYLVVACDDEVYVYETTNFTKVGYTSSLEVDSVGTMFSVRYGPDAECLLLAGEDGII